jgi:hypothetical protein
MENKPLKSIKELSSKAIFHNVPCLNRSNGLQFLLKVSSKSSGDFVFIAFMRLLQISISSSFID